MITPEYALFDFQFFGLFWKPYKSNSNFKGRGEAYEFFDYWHITT